MDKNWDSTYGRSYIDESNEHLSLGDRIAHNRKYFYETGTPELLNLIEVFLRSASPGHQRYIKRHLWHAVNDLIKHPEKKLGYEHEPARRTGRRDRYGRFIGYKDARPEPPKRDDKGRFLPKEEHA